MRHSKRISAGLIVTAWSAFGGLWRSCSSSGDGEIDELKLVLNWFPKAQHGGVYASLEEDLFEENQIDLSVEPGGPQVSPIQIVAAGDAEFGLAHADQLVIAKNQGIDLVAIAATMQGSPQAFMFHDGVDIQDFEDLNGREVFVQPGITYWDFLKSEYNLSNVQELAYNGQNVTFIENKESVTQAFLTSEPFFLEREGVKTNTLLVSESGYDPYNVVLFVTKDYLEENEELVQRFVDTYLEGLDLYEENYEAINEKITDVNPNIALEELNYEADTQYDYVYGFDAAEHGTGYMSAEKWEELKNQLLDIDLLDEDFDVDYIFTTKFLSK
ncbi:ABC transporter substrate-binding protein [Alkalicoccobacillus plakortidis]|uniref:ABC transporter substrate-binding protein n=1 Tax=Alkalicoccobacillus plakortidis TaxID=444060 RepID=A0ABT0XID6_9BACI|nr:ABC transporter substrate-binding protein [Alkalicoccobacillus plakortidis]MCM2675662.1 ABC transporter substrate-binding protein [Alkalicoccobacillus plakortidis]